MLPQYVDEINPAGYADVAKLLLDTATALGMTALIDAADFKGRSALHLASAHQHDACVKLLLSCACAVHCKSPKLQRNQSP